MRKYLDSLIDSSGNALSGATITVYNTGTLVKPTIYSDDGVTPIANPVSTDANGRFSFYVADGRYDLAVAGSGIVSYTLSDLEVSDLVGSSSSADLVWKSNKVSLADGSAAAPSINFQSATTTGLSRVSGALTLSVAGTGYWNVDSTGAWQPNANGSYDLGTTSFRVANLYVNGIPAGCTLTSPTITTPTISAPTISGVATLASATLSSTITSYNGIATVGNGVPSIVATVDLTGQTAAIGTTTLYTTTNAGPFRLNWNAKVTTVAGVSSTLGALTIVYTDPDSVAQTITAPASIAAGTIATTSTGNTTTTVLLGMPLVLNCKTGTVISYAFGYASNAANAMNYNAHLRLESL